MREGLTFDDVLLVPQHSTIASRSLVSPATKVAGINLKIPIISANMDTITEVKMAMEMSRLGGAGILHRYADEKTVMGWLDSLLMSDAVGIPSIGTQEGDADLGLRYWENGADAICVDVAHGDSTRTVATIKRLRQLGITNIIAGNVATYDGASRLIDAGANCVKVGVGGGGVCQTRIQTGHGVPQLTAILEVAKLKKQMHGISVIADGGVRYAGDIVKALAAGADAVMCGGLLAGTDETPGEPTFGEHIIGVNYTVKLKPSKIYRGMASREAQLEKRGSVHNDTPEGVSTTVECKGPVETIIKELVGGIRSGLSYSGCSSIEDLQETAEFIKVTPNTVVENGTHFVKNK